MIAKQAYRKLKKEETEILNALFAKNFPYRDAIREQIDNSLVRSVNCKCGCNTIEFSTKSKNLIPTKERIPVEASYFKGEQPYEILLHVVDGKVNELEFVTYGDIVDLGYPKTGDLRITINGK